MGSSSSRQSVNLEIETMLSNPVIEQVLPSDVQPVNNPILETPEVMQELESIPYDQYSKQKLARKIVSLSDIVIRRMNDQQQSPSYQLALKLMQLTKGNAEAALSALQMVGEQLGVDRHLVRDANLQNERSVRKLAKSVVKLLIAAVSLFSSRIALSTALRAYSVARFGVTPYAIQYLYHQRGLSIIGVPSGAACLYLTGRFIYLHPEILSLLRRFNDPDNSQFFLENMDLTVAAIAIRQVFTNELSFLLHEAYKLETLKRDLEVLVPMGRTVVTHSAQALETVVHTTEWADETMNHLIEYGTANTTRTFVFWLQNKTHLVGAVIEVISNLTGVNYIKDKVVEAGAAAMKKVQTMASTAKRQAIEYLHSTKHGRSVYEASAKMYDTLSSSLSSSLSWVSNWFDTRTDNAIEHLKESAFQQLSIETPLSDVSESLVAHTEPLGYGSESMLSLK